MKDMVPDHDQNVPVTIFEDNQGAIALAKNPVHHNEQNTLMSDFTSYVNK